MSSEGPGRPVERDRDNMRDVLAKIALYVIYTWSLGLCYGFVLISSAEYVADLYQKGARYRYLTGTSSEGPEGRIVGFEVEGEVLIGAVWGEGQRKLVRVELKSPKLRIKSRKSPTPDTFTGHDSKLDAWNNDPFYVLWNHGKVDAIFVRKNETTPILNLKKGISSLLQFQLDATQITETDASGTCTVTYDQKSPTRILKRKTNCLPSDLDLQDQDEVLGTQLRSNRWTEIEVNDDFTHIHSVKSEEIHSVHHSAKVELGASLRSWQELSFLGLESVDEVNGDSLLEKIVDGLVREELSVKILRGGGRSEFSKLFGNVREYLKQDLGTLKPARAFLKLVNAAKSANKEEIIKVLQSKKNKDIQFQLLDVLGYVQTDDSHSAVSKLIHLDKENQMDLNERYLWALSFCSHPNPEIVKDLLKKFTRAGNIPEKVKETLILTIASMSRKLARGNGNSKIVQEVQEAILNGLDYAKNEEKYPFFRALKNLQSPATLPVLLHYVRKGSQKEGILAWKAIRSFPRDNLDETILKTAEKTVFQLDRKHDSSSRVLALDILLQPEVKDDFLKDLLRFVASNETAYEVRQFTFQKINMVAATYPEFNERVVKLVRSDPRLNNYSGLSPRGLSTALTRRFLSSPSSNGSLVSYQEIQSGIVKMGMVNVLMEKGEVTKEVFSLGIFTGGLHSFMSGNDEAEEDGAEEEIVTAGMELTVFDNQIRPFVFFTGQGELMGHVWSGTASEKTSAFQVLALVQDHLEHLRLGSGLVAVHSSQGAVSFDLSGKIEISLWNRNAETSIEKSAGLLLNGRLGIDAGFAETAVDFSGNLEMQLHLQSNIDFSSDTKACVRLMQPDTVFRHNVVETERIPGTKYNRRISTQFKINVPGTTYALNRKNNEMCSLLFK